MSFDQEQGVISMNTCGECKACCVVLPIADPEIVKPAGEPCQHLCESGCGIYEKPEWPQLCRDYFCAWRQVEWLGTRPLYRPDKLGVIFQFHSEVLAIFEIYPGASQSSQVQYVKNRLRGTLKVRIYPVGILDGITFTPEMVGSDGQTKGDVDGVKWEYLGGDEYILRRIAPAGRIPLPVAG